MAKNENRTLDVILSELEAKVKEYNDLPETDPKRAELTVETKNLVDEYNELSWLTVFSTCLQAELPIKAAVETFTYNTVSTADKPHKEVVNGVKRDVYTRSLKEGPKMIDIVKFIEWAAERNIQVAASKDWKIEMLRSKQAIKAEWKKFFASKGDTTSISNRKMKEALQKMFDALIFIPTPTGKNAVIADKDVVNLVFAFANKMNANLDGSTSDGDILPESIWRMSRMKALRKAVTGKELVFSFCEDEDKVPEEEEATASPAPEQPATDNK